MIAPPARLRAALPAELRGMARDAARLCVVEREGGQISHTTVARLGEHLTRGDLLVVNSSRTLPGALPVTREDGGRVHLRPAVMRDAGWDALVVEPSPPHANISLRAGEVLSSHSGLRLRVAGRRDGAPLLWRVLIEAGDPLNALLRDAEPIRYSYIPEPVAPQHYQTVFADAPGSVETPSAGRHLTWELLGGLRRRGVDLASIVLHCSISSMQDDDVDARKPLIEERYSVTAGTAHRVNAAPRVIAVGTTVVRALESAAGASGKVRQAEGWTRLAIHPGTPLRAVDALFTGLHEPPASHLDMIRAFLDRDLLERAYAEVMDRGYLWHEFGDAMLIL